MNLTWRIQIYEFNLAHSDGVLNGVKPNVMLVLQGPGKHQRSQGKL